MVKLKLLLTVLLVPLLILLGYRLGGASNWQHLWPFLLGYGVGALYMLVQLRLNRMN